MILEIVLIVLTVFILITLARIFLGPTIWDRLLGFNLVSTKIIMLISLYALLKDKTYYLDISILYALFGFISVITIARFIKRKGSI